MSDLPSPLRRELLVAFAILLGTALLIAGVSLAVVYPLLRSPWYALGFILGLLGLDLLIVLFFGRRLLQESFVDPVERVVADAQRISAGDYAHRIGPTPAAELEAIRESVNELADRLVTDQSRLAENVKSLDRTNAELVATRDELIQTARLASVGTLASGIAHEVGNPLGALMGFTDLARMRARKGGDDTELLDAIRGEAERIDRVIRTLLEYARGHVGDAARAFEVEGVAERVVELLEAQGRLTNVDVSVHVDEDVPAVFGRPQQLEQVLLNLALNAIDALEEARSPSASIVIGIAAEEGGFIRMPRRRDDDPDAIDYTHRRRVATDFEVGGPDTLHTASRNVLIRVEDNGPGIDAEHLERLFDPFFTTKDPGKGTGLGLAICARLVDGMGGRIHAESPEGAGAVFTIRLPALQPSEVA